MPYAIQKEKERQLIKPKDDDDEWDEEEEGGATEGGEEAAEEEWSWTLLIEWFYLNWMGENKKTFLGS